MKLAVFSFGGVASKFFIKGIVTASNNKRWQCHHGHERSPPATVDDNTRVVYMFGNPMNAVLSFFNRRIQRSHLHGFGDQEDQCGDKEWAVKHCKNVYGDWRSLDPAWDLEDYLRNGKDLFRLEDHFNRWATAKRPYPILLLRYETLWDNLYNCKQFFRTPEFDIKQFPVQQKRYSDWQTLSQPIQDMLYEIYGGLYERINKFADAKLLEPIAKYF